MTTTNAMWWTFRLAPGALSALESDRNALILVDSYLTHGAKLIYKQEQTENLSMKLASLFERWHSIGAVLKENGTHLHVETIHILADLSGLLCAQVIQCNSFLPADDTEVNLEPIYSHLVKYFSATARDFYFFDRYVLDYNPSTLDGQRKLIRRIQGLNFICEIIKRVVREPQPRLHIGCWISDERDTTARRRYSNIAGLNSDSRWSKGSICVEFYDLCRYTGVGHARVFVGTDWGIFMDQGLDEIDNFTTKKHLSMKVFHWVPKPSSASDPTGCPSAFPAKETRSYVAWLSSQSPIQNQS